MELHPVKASPKKRTSNNTNALFNKLKKDLKGNWDDIFKLAYDTCYSLVLKYAKQHKLAFTDDHVFDATSESASVVMRRISNGKDPKYFTTYCFYAVWSTLAGTPAQKVDKEVLAGVWCENELGNDTQEEAFYEIPATEFNEKTKYNADTQDIVYTINDLTYCCLQRERDQNNLLVQVKKPHATTFKDVMIFLDILYTVYAIDYVSVYLENPIWNKVLGRFKLAKKDDKQYYGSLEENIEEIRKYSRRNQI